MIVAQWLAELSDAGLETYFQAWPAGDAHRLLVFLPESEIGNIPHLQAHARAKGIAMAGAMFPQLLVDDRLVAAGAILIRIAGAPPPAILTGVSGDVAGTADALTAHVDRHLGADDTAALLCVFDAMVPNIATHLDAWYLVQANRLRYVGVNAGNERFTPAPCLFDGDRFVGDGVLLQLLPGHPGAVLEHGFATPSTLITATSSEGNRIVQIDWRPALEVYSALIHERHGIVVDKETFYTHATHFPFGIVRADGEMLIRIPVALAEDGSIVCVGEIPPNSILALLDAHNDLAPIPDSLAGDMAELAPGADGGDALLFYCAGRRLYMGERLTDELEAFCRHAHTPHLYGAVSLGEIGGAHGGGYPLFHNATVVALPCLHRR